MRLRPLALVTLAASFTLLLSACGADPERAAIEEYLASAESIGDQMSGAGSRFETLMNAQGDMTAWTPAEKTEVHAIGDTFDRLEAEARLVAVPPILIDAHPLLIQSLTELNAAVHGVIDMADHPERVTEAAADELTKKATLGEQYGTEYVEKVKAALGEKYPDLVKE